MHLPQMSIDFKGKHIVIDRILEAAQYASISVADLCNMGERVKDNFDTANKANAAKVSGEIGKVRVVVEGLMDVWKKTSLDTKVILETTTKTHKDVQTVYHELDVLNEQVKQLKAEMDVVVAQNQLLHGKVDGITTLLQESRRQTTLLKEQTTLLKDTIFQLLNTQDSETHTRDFESSEAQIETLEAQVDDHNPVNRVDVETPACKRKEVVDLSSEENSTNQQG